MCEKSATVPQRDITHANTLFICGTCVPHLRFLSATNYNNSTSSSAS